VLSTRGDVLAVSDDRGTVRLWDALTRQPAGRPIASHHAVTGLALSPDGKILAVAGDGLQLWSTASGQRIGGPLPAADAAGPVAFSPDGRLVAAIGADGKARLWQVATRQETGVPVTTGPGQGALAFSPDGTMLITVSAGGSSSGSARLWNVAFPAGLLAAACAIADQSLTREEWADYAGTQPFQQVCPAS
jgi:WD40 repeat protein